MFKYTYKTEGQNGHVFLNCLFTLSQPMNSTIKTKITQKGRKEIHSWMLAWLNYYTK